MHADCVYSISKISLRRAASNTSEQKSRSDFCESDPSRSDRDRRARPTYNRCENADNSFSELDQSNNYFE